jgi:hypothetical protein
MHNVTCQIIDRADHLSIIVLMDIPLTSLDACSSFLESQPFSLVAARLLCPRGKESLVSSLTAYLESAREISKDVPDVPIAVARMRYANIVANIKAT